MTLVKLMARAHELPFQDYQKIYAGKKMKSLQEVLKLAADQLQLNNKAEASKLIDSSFPFHSSSSEPASKKRSYTPKQKLQVFIKDGFVDRYTGVRLIYPSALYALAHELPNSLPYGGKKVNSHSALFDLFPTIDHITPISKNGKDVEDNWLTTSFSKNLEKSSSTLEELGWELKPAGDMSEWDGLCSWYLEYAKGKSNLENLFMRNKEWHQAIIDNASLILDPKN